MSVAANQLITRGTGCRGNHPVAGSTRLYQGTLAFLNASGYLDDDTASGVNRFAGVNEKDVDNSSGSAGDLRAETLRDGQFLLVGAGFALTSVGQDVYATDNYTLTLNGSAPGAVYVGQITEYVSATKVWVELDPREAKRKSAATVAAAGSTQSDAAQLTADVNTVTGADGTKGVLLPPGVAGKEVVVYSTHATNGLKVYPASGADINDGTADAAVTIEGKTIARFVALDATTWAASYTANS